MVVEKVLTSDFFSLFDLPRTFTVDQTVLDTRYRELQAQVHPDKFAQAVDTQKRLSMQWATRANEAYQTLKSPLQRATYLLKLADFDVGAESNTAMPAAFLMEQMEWREAVMDAKAGKDVAALEKIDELLQTEITARFTSIGQLLDQSDWAKAAEQVRCQMFLEKLRHDLADTIDELED